MKTLDLTNNEWKSDSDWKYVGLEILNRPHKKLTIILALSCASLSLVLPDFGLGGIYAATKILGIPINTERYLPRLRRIKYKIEDKLKW